MKNAQVVHTRSTAVIRGLQESPLAERAVDRPGKGVRRISPVAGVPASSRITGDIRIARGEEAECSRKTVAVSTGASVSELAARLAAVLVAAVISFGLLGSVVWLFQSDGAPLQRVAAVERACAGRVYLSERQACMTAALRSLGPPPVPACAAAPTGDTPRMQC